MTIRVKNAEFIWGSPDLKKLPGHDSPEIAVIGRSNVGKSSFINRLANNSKLARSSSTPGRTREFNFFEFKLAVDSPKDKKVIIADLPGFGFAKFSKEECERLSELTVRYLNTRSQLGVICILNDCRREPQREELAMQKLAFDSGKHVLVVVTKTDKLKRNELNKSLKSIAAHYGLEAEDLILSGQGGSTDGFWARVLPLL